MKGKKMIRNGGKNEREREIRKNEKGKIFLKKNNR